MSSPGELSRLDAALDRILDAPTDARARLVEALVANELADAPALGDELRRLVATLDRQSALDEPAADLSRIVAAVESRAAEPDAEDLEPGARVGAYRIEQRIGAGGMGTVYRAQRADGAFERVVAIKLVRRGLDSARFSAHFGRERAILARLEHPGITSLLDAGALADGRPYLVMEFVDGVALREHRLAQIDDRVRLVIALCDAVAYAHERLIVHRDIKPSNVLVRSDGAPVLLDFGIAGLLAAQASEATRRQERLLSPRWAAPEQLAGAEVGIRADVWGLGLILHVLLTGREAVERDEHGRCPPPSSFVDKRERRSLVGDLDAICSKALALDPDERYASASALADELRRYLAGAAVAARSGRLYRFARFVRVHRVALTGLSALVMLLVAYAVTVTLQSRALARERDRARAQAERAERLAGFLETILTAEYAAAVEGDEPTVREALDRASERLADTDLGPEIRVDLLLLTARAYYALGRMDEALALAHDAELVCRGLEPVPIDALVESLRLQALAHAGGQRPAPGRASALEALQLGLAHAGPLDPELAETLETLAALYVADHPLAAFGLYASGLAARLVTRGPFDPTLARPLSGLALSCTTCEDPSGWLRLGLRIQIATLGPSHAEVAGTLQKLAHYAPPDEARALLERALAIERAVLGPAHPWTANTLNDLALLVEGDDPALATEYLEQARDVVDAAFVEGHPRRLLARQNLAAVLRDRGRLDEAEAMLDEALERAALASPGRVLQLAYHLGLTYEAQGRSEAAREVYRRGLEACSSFAGPVARIDELGRRLLAIPPVDARRDCSLVLRCLGSKPGGHALADAISGLPSCADGPEEPLDSEHL